MSILPFESLFYLLNVSGAFFECLSNILNVSGAFSECLSFLLNLYSTLFQKRPFLNSKKDVKNAHMFLYFVTTVILPLSRE